MWSVQQHRAGASQTQEPPGCERERRHGGIHESCLLSLEIQCCPHTHTVSDTRSGTQAEDFKAQSELLYLNSLSSTQDFIETVKLLLYLSALYTSVCIM